MTHFPQSLIPIKSGGGGILTNSKRAQRATQALSMREDSGGEDSESEVRFYLGFTQRSLGVTENKKGLFQVSHVTYIIFVEENFTWNFTSGH